MLWRQSKNIKHKTKYSLAVEMLEWAIKKGFPKCTVFLPNREFLRSLGFPGYNGYMSDSEVFTHILHYAITKLGLNIEAYKHIITPLREHMLAEHPQEHLLRNLKHTCRRLIIDGPNCVIGCLPDNTLFMVQDRKKLRPGVVGGKKAYLLFHPKCAALMPLSPTETRKTIFNPCISIRQI